jgi:bacterioferritin
MAQKGLEIVNIDKAKLIDQLSGALAEEWLAYYQYWLVSKIIEGPMRKELSAELVQRACQEFNHANQLADRILQLGGKPILNPAHFFKFSDCKYQTPDNPYVEVVLRQNLAAERCAIQRYNNIIELTRNKDDATYLLATNILTDELQHEQEIEHSLKDLERLKEEIIKLQNE